MLRKSVVWYLVCAMFLISIVPNVQAGYVPSNALTPNADQRAADLDKIKNVLETKLVTQRLNDLGFNSDEVKERLSLLSDQQLHNYAQRLDTLRTGGDGVGFVIGLLVVVILVIVILQLTGHKVIVK